MDDTMLEIEEEQSSESQSSSDSEMEEQDSNLDELEATLAAQPDNYDAHVQYVQSLRKMGKLDKLRGAREAMSSLFPLSGEMWREWAKDEANLLAGGNSGGDISSVESLYERGVKEYLHVPLWVDYLEFVEERDMAVAQCTPEGLAKMRALCEKAVTIAGLHFSEGSSVWDAYREFENAVLVAMADRNEEERTKQASRVRSLFHRQLSVALSTHESTLEEYIDWEKEQGIIIGNEEDPLAAMDATLLSSYKRAKSTCDDYQTFEENVGTEKPADADLLQSYLIYISFEENRASSDPARVQVLYERAIARFPVTSDLWLKYTSYLDQNLKKVPIVCLSVYSRAIRNCPWVEEFWRKYMLALERFNSSDEEISRVFEQSIQKSFQTPNEYVSLFLTRIDCLRRQNADTERLRKMFQRASEFLETYFPDYVDRGLQLYGYWARVETRLCKDIEAARGVWEDLIKRGAWVTEFWQAYIDMETRLGNVKEAGKLYKRCYGKRLEENGTEVICLAWLQFEREYGTLEEYENAAFKVNQKLQEVQSQQLSQEAAEQKAIPKPRAEARRGEDYKRKRGKDVKETKKKRKLPPKREPYKQIPEHSSGAAAPAAEDSGAAAAAEDSGALDSGSLDSPGKAQAQGPKQRAPRVHDDKLTVFVSNLGMELAEEDLEKFFARCGGIKGIRMPKDRNTRRSRGIAYVEFETEENLAAAVALNKKKLRDRKLCIMRSDPENRGKKNKPVQPLGWTDPKKDSETEEKAPKSNSEFRDMFLKK